MRKAAMLSLLIVWLGGCARSAIGSALDDGPLVSDVSNVEAASGDVDGGGGERDEHMDDDASTQPDDDVVPNGDDGDDDDDGGKVADDAGGERVCPNAPAACEQAQMLGMVDASNDGALMTHQGIGSGWFVFKAKDGNRASAQNARIGVEARFVAPAGSTYRLTLVGDTGPEGGGACATNDVSDPEPFRKTATWGALGPLTSSLRVLSVHIEHVDGACDAPWTLTIMGNPCPQFTGAGQDSAGSCD